MTIRAFRNNITFVRKGRCKDRDYIASVAINQSKSATRHGFGAVEFTVTRRSKKLRVASSRSLLLKAF